MRRVARWIWELRTPKKLIPAICLALLIGFLSHELNGETKQKAAGVPNPAASPRQGVLVSSGANPLPDSGFPHGRGITLADFPHGYLLNGRPRASFNNYVAGAPALGNERHLLRTCYLRSGENRCLRAPQANHPIGVAPGDRLLISALIDNNGDPSGNDHGRGPAVARDSRISFNYPNGSGMELDLGAFLYARNTVVDEMRPRLKTVSDNLAFRSATGEPIAFEYQHEARYLCANHVNPSKPIGSRYLYTQWRVTAQQQYWMFTGLTRNVQANPEADFNLGLPIGSTGGHGTSRGKLGLHQSDRLNFYAGDAYHCFLQFVLQVRGKWQ